MNMNVFDLHALFGKRVPAIATIVFLAIAANTAFAMPAGDDSSTNEIVQQTLTISGTVKDPDNMPLVGASVREKEATNGTVTDSNGYFEIKVKDAEAVLVVSFLGYTTKEIVVGNNRQLSIILEEDVNLLDELVVIGYGTQRKGDITSAIVSIKSEDFSIGKIGDAAELVKGKVAGLSIVKSSGDPNALSSIMLRGVTTLMGNVSPLVLVDGIEGNLSTVAPENVASIDVLKDASAAAIYGTRGANGVILVTTRTGQREQKASAAYSSYLSFSGWYKKAGFMDTRDIIYGRTNFSYEGYDTDWLAAISRKAGYTQNHSLTLTGGSKSSAYSANATYSDEEGIMRRSDSRDLKAQLDFTQYAIDDILKFNVNLLYGRHKNTNNNNTFAYRQALIHNPSSPIYNDDGSYYEEFSRYEYYNPVSMQNEMIGDSRSQLARLTGNVTLEPIKGWQTNLMVSVKENTGEGQTYYTSDYYSQTKASIKGWAAKSSGNSRSDNLELTSRYDFMANNHRMSALAGYSYLYNVNDGFSAGNGNFPTQAYLYNNMGEGTYLTDEDHTASMGSYKNDNTLIGFFGRVSYGYADRYNALVSLRYEGSSKFGPNNKWGTFPSVSLGWTVSNEDFLKEQSWLNNLKLRTGYGVTGVIPGDSYLSLTMFSFDPYGKHLSKDGKWTPSLQVSQNPNPNLKWETTREFNIGLDWSILNNRLGGAIDLYTKKTSDLLYDYSVPVPPNIYSSIRANVGQMRNNGVEVMINAVPVKNADLEYSTTLTLSHNSNKLLSLENELYETENFIEAWSGLGEPITVPTHCVEVGSRLGDFWGLKSVGVSKNGVVLVEVSDGAGGWTVREFETKYNEKVNRQRLGNGMPQVYAGWNHTLRYKGFDLSLQFTAQFGFKILNTQRSFYENNSIAYNRLKSAAGWHGAIDETGAPVIDPETGQQALVQLSRSMAQGFWSSQLENGDFVKLTNATLGYTLPIKGAVTKFIKMARVYVSGQNLFCITGYSGLDPEVSNYYWAPGVDERDKYPTIRSFTVGLNIHF
jgi:TonB-linked SusC/RagA family outer membrane protein